ncbi:hypothetical protein GPALN_007724 [Globodera pallida]|nr:hypothetical protein GPALN_007724 [Globodera pallida]
MSSHWHPSSNEPSFPFIMHYLLYQRKCQGLFGIDPIPETYQNVTLTIEHNCIEENKIVIPLGDIGPNQFKDNRAELNGLYIILNKNFGVRQLSREGALTHRSERELEWEWDNVEDEKESEAVQEQSKFRHLFWILN